MRPAMPAGKGEAPKLLQQPGPLSRAKVSTEAARRQSTPPRDSRALVAARLRAAEALDREDARPHSLTDDQRRRLRELAARPIGDEAKVMTALRDVGELTSCDLSLSLRISAPHARISELRRAGAPIVAVGWVRQPWGSGRDRVLKLYAIRAD